jgi:rhomboid protease GluP
MKTVNLLAPSRMAALLAAAIVLAWCLSAYALNQPLFAVQTSKALMPLGAANGDLLSTGEWWRIVTSQFLHVRFLHMLFNAACIALVGAAIEQRWGWWKLALIYLAGGSVGQLASVVAYPGLVSSGASQALMALCAAAFVVRTGRRLRVFVVCILAVQVALDLHVAQGIKAGHGFGFLGGLLVALALSVFGSTRPADTHRAASTGGHRPGNPS